VMTVAVSAKRWLPNDGGSRKNRDPDSKKSHQFGRAPETRIVDGQN